MVYNICKSNRTRKLIVFIFFIFNTIPLVYPIKYTQTLLTFSSNITLVVSPAFQGGGSVSYEPTVTELEEINLPAQKKPVELKSIYSHWSFYMFALIFATILVILFIKFKREKNEEEEQDEKKT